VIVAWRFVVVVDGKWKNLLILVLVVGILMAGDLFLVD
jgi:hypothetical protein